MEKTHACSGTTSASDTLVKTLFHWTASKPNHVAFRFVNERCEVTEILSYSELEFRARAVARELIRHGEAGARAVLIFDPGLDFLVAFFGCLYAGVIAVPVAVPKRGILRESTSSIFRNSDPRLVLTTEKLRQSLSPVITASGPLADAEWIEVDSILKTPASYADEGHPSPTLMPACDTAFLQYTSGSTSDPKGTVIKHANLMSNLRMIAAAMGTNQSSSIVSWVPLHHDMGLTLNALHAVYVGGSCTLMSPLVFLQRPLSWLHAIDKFKADVAGAPNFAYDLCVERFNAEILSNLDLSSWRIAFNAAEPVRAETIRVFTKTYSNYGFHRSAFYPCYGMAEATVFISGGTDTGEVQTRFRHETATALGSVQEHARSREVVCCGRASVGERLHIVDPETRDPLNDDAIGEIWVAGPHVAAGYWRNFEATQMAFGWSLADSNEAVFLRTGDLGFIKDRHVYFVGRLKDIIIVHGKNFYPQDIELIAERTHPALQSNANAAFGLDTGNGEVLVIVQEIARVHRRSFDPAAAAGCIRKAVLSEIGVSVRDIVFVLPGTVPKTTSGKIRRSCVRDLYLGGMLKNVAGCAEEIE